MRYQILSISMLLLLSSCLSSDSQLSEQECNELALAAFRGFPKAANRLQNECQHVNITYTKEHCQKALNGLIFGKPYEQLKEEFGKDVHGCFSKADIQKFAKDEDREILMNMSKE